MKELLSIIISLLIGSGICTGQSISEIFKNDEFLKGIFVNPMGIKLPEASESDSLENKIKKSGLEYNKMSLGPFGEFFSFTPSDLDIGGTPIKGVGIGVNTDSSMVLYQSAPTSEYGLMYESLDNALKPYSINIENLGAGNRQFSVYMLSDRYGVAVGSDDIKQISIACLLDIKSLKGFLSLAPLIGE